MTEVNALPLDDGTVIDAALEPIATVSPFAPMTNAVTAETVVPAAGLVAEERDRAAELARQLTSAVRQHEANRPRSLQRRIGPSEVGSPCTRSLGYKLAGVEPVNVGGGDPWPTFVGTAVHAALEDVMNGRPAAEGWVTERRVTVDPELDLHGSTDLLRLTGGITVVDHKCVSAGTLKSARTNGPASYYVVQANLYAHGWIAAGVPVEWVAIAYWPKSGWLKDLHVWLQRYDQDVVDRALERYAVLRKVIETAGASAIPALPAAAHFCDGCAFYRPGSTDLTSACPGAH